MNKVIKRFSLIELICVICIIMILIAVSVKLFSNYVDSAKNGQTKALIAQLTSALQAYKIDQGYYPAGASSYPSAIPSNWWTSSYYQYFFKFNYSNAVDTALIKYFNYQGLKGTGFIRTIGSPYNCECIIDAWGNPLLYYYNGTGGYFNDTMFDLGSLGKDGKYGSGSISSSDFGKGDDITNFNQ